MTSKSANYQVPELNRVLTQGLLAELPLLYTQGQPALHRLHGACTVIKAHGPSARLIEIPYLKPISRQPDVAQIWTTISDLAPLVDISEATELGDLQSQWGHESAPKK